MSLAVFLVEDDRRIRDHLVLLILDVLHARVVGTAETSDDALAWLARNDGLCDLVVLDLFLREGTGLFVLKHMTPAHRQRCVVLTNSPSPTNIALCLDLGAEAVFDKSLQIEDFLDYCALLEVD